MNNLKEKKMNANELRICNYVEIGLKRDLTSIYSTVHQISQTVIWVKEPSAPTLRLMPIETIKPIPLTEEWLLKFGFKKRKNRHLFYWENKIVISEYKDEFENFFYPKTGYDIRFSNEIQFIHQLQNLYFALTNTELKCEKE